MKITNILPSLIAIIFISSQGCVGFPKKLLIQIFVSVQLGIK
jgi:hypothetical protein